MKLELPSWLASRPDVSAAFGSPVCCGDLGEHRRRGQADGEVGDVLAVRAGRLGLGRGHRDVHRRLVGVLRRRARPRSAAACQHASRSTRSTTWSADPWRTFRSPCLRAFPLRGRPAASSCAHPRVRMPAAPACSYPRRWSHLPSTARCATARITRQEQSDGREPGDRGAARVGPLGPVRARGGRPLPARALPGLPADRRAEGRDHLAVRLPERAPGRARRPAARRCTTSTWASSRAPSVARAGTARCSRCAPAWPAAERSSGRPGRDRRGEPVLPVPPAGAGAGCRPGARTRGCWCWSATRSSEPGRTTGTRWPPGASRWTSPPRWTPSRSGWPGAEEDLRARGRLGRPPAATASTRTSSRGAYAEQLRRWLAHFPREQLLVHAGRGAVRRPRAGVAPDGRRSSAWPRPRPPAVRGAQPRPGSPRVTAGWTRSVRARLWPRCSREPNADLADAARASAPW